MRIFSILPLLLCGLIVSAQKSPMPDSAKIVAQGVKFCQIYRLENDSSKTLVLKSGYDRRGNVIYKSTSNNGYYYLYGYDEKNRLIFTTYRSQSGIISKSTTTFDDSKVERTERKYNSSDTVKPYSEVVYRQDGQITYSMYRYGTFESYSRFYYTIKGKDSIQIDSLPKSQLVRVHTTDRLIEKRTYSSSYQLLHRYIYEYNKIGQILKITDINNLNTVYYEFEYNKQGLRVAVYRNKQKMDQKETDFLMQDHDLDFPPPIAHESGFELEDARQYEYQTEFNSQGLPVRVKITETNGSFLKSWTEIYVYEYY